MPAIDGRIRDKSLVGRGKVQTTGAMDTDAMEDSKEASVVSVSDNKNNDEEAVVGTNEADTIKTGFSEPENNLTCSTSGGQTMGGDKTKIRIKPGRNLAIPR